MQADAVIGFDLDGVFAPKNQAPHIALALETSILVVFAFGARRFRREFGVLDWSLRPREMLTLLRIGLPAGGQFVADILAWSIFGMTVMGVFGTYRDAQARQRYVGNVRDPFEYRVQRTLRHHRNG